MLRPVPRGRMTGCCATAGLRSKRQLDRNTGTHAVRAHSRRTDDEKLPGDAMRVLPRRAQHGSLLDASPLEQIWRLRCAFGLV
jgi:hypothetical protein